MNIGVLGGSFDPIHLGHLALAQAAREELDLERLIFVPAGQHPVKAHDAFVASPDQRLDMVRLAIKDEDNFEVSDFEIKKPGISYTVDTLQFLRQTYPEPHQLFLITGGDWARRLDEWKEIDTIFKLAQFVVASRPGFDLNELPKAVRALRFVPKPISSTQVRDVMATPDKLSLWIPPLVASYIKEHQLYELKT